MVSQSSSERPGIIYLATNKVNGKIYVGKTAREFFVRIREHEYDARNKANTAFSRAIAKYGIEAFSFEVLETCPVEDIDERERFWISQRKCRKPHGYNLTDGGDGTIGLKRPDVTARLCAMTGERNHQFGKKHSPEMVEVYRKASSGENNARYGVVLSEEFRLKLSGKIKAAMSRPEVRERFLAGLEARRPKIEARKIETAKRNARRKAVERIENNRRFRVRQMFMKMWDDLAKSCWKEWQREAMRVAFNSPEVRERRSESARNRAPASAEARANISAAKKLYWERKRSAA